MDKVIHLSKVEYLNDKAGKPFCQLTDKDGETYKVGQGQGGKLKSRWSALEQAVGHDVKLIYADFTAPNGKTYPYVADFVLPTPEQGKPLADTPSMAKAMDAQRPDPAKVWVGDKKSDAINKAVALKGAIDLASNKVIPVAEILSYAHNFELWLSGEFNPVYKNVP